MDSIPISLANVKKKRHVFDFYIKYSRAHFNANRKNLTFTFELLYFKELLVNQFSLVF